MEDCPAHTPTAMSEYELASGGYYEELKDIFSMDLIDFFGEVSPKPPVSIDQGWATLRVTRASIVSTFYQGARLLIHVHTPFTPFYSISFLLKEMKV